MAAGDALALVKAVPRAVPDPAEVAGLPHHDMATDMVKSLAGMAVVLPPGHGDRYRTMPASASADVLRRIARQVDLTRYREATRGPKRPPKS